MKEEAGLARRLQDGRQRGELGGRGCSKEPSAHEAFRSGPSHHRYINDCTSG
jgi:hypothetical protein